MKEIKACVANRGIATLQEICGISFQYIPAPPLLRVSIIAHDELIRATELPLP